jgi:pimeloyl-ACP methyl ester carboxylesterase
MATIVLVHGGWHGAWCWARLTPLLASAGHRVVTPTLTGVGERVAEASPEIDVTAHIDDLTEQIVAGALTGVVLVGHSYGGMVITGVADRLPERIDRLIYLDAFVPQSGQAVVDLLPPARRRYYEQTAADGDGWRVPPPPVSAMGITDAADVVWVADRLTPQPLATLTEPFRATRAPSPDLPRSFIHCTSGPATASFAPFAAQARATPGWSLHELATGHDAMLTAPEALASLLLALVAAPADVAHG